MEDGKLEATRQNSLNKSAELFLEGFILKCAESGIDSSEQIADLLLKASDDDRVNMVLKDLLRHPLTTMAAGTGLGSGVGYLLGFDPLLSGIVGLGGGAAAADWSVPGRTKSKL